MSEGAQPADSSGSDHAADERDPVSYNVALAAAVVLGLAAILTAWCSFQSARSSGAVTQHYADQQTLIASANDTYAQSDQASQLEQQFFLTYAINLAQGNDGAVSYLTDAMSDELAAAVVWWSEQPAESVPPTPFVDDNPEYHNLSSQLYLADGNTLMDQADQARVAAEEAGKVGDRFGLANVMFAIVLFLAGIATLLQRTRIQVGVLILGVVILIVGAVIMVTTQGWASVA